MYDAVATQASLTHQFTGKERDSESGLDDFDARHYGYSLGRFMSPDPAGLLAQKPSYPQSWNLYAYAMNNPLIIIDPTGLDCVYANDAGCPTSPRCWEKWECQTLILPSSGQPSCPPAESGLVGVGVRPC